MELLRQCRKRVEDVSRGDGVRRQKAGMARKETWGELLNFSSPWRKLWANRYFVQQITLRNMQTKFKGSFLGAVWLLVFPLLMLTIYSFVFCVVFKTRWGAVAGQQDSKMMFALMLFCGMAVYNIFSESVGGGVSSITDRVNYVKKIITPLELLPLTSVGSALIVSLLWFAILVVGVLLVYGFLPWTVICLPLLLIPVTLFSAGCAWFVASLGVYIRDFGQLVPILLQVLFFLTPIFYSQDMLPEPYRSIMAYNPLAVLVQHGRMIFLYGKLPPFHEVFWMYLCSFAVFELGYLWFMKTKRGFADVI